MRRVFATRSVLALLVWVAVGSSAHAGIMITQYQTNQAGGGVNIQAQYTLDPGITCPPANVRWIQRILLKDGMGNQKDDVPGYPSGNFIDPQPGQPGGPFDTDPWYDITYNTAADRAADVNRQNGAGRFFNDSPAGWGPFGPMSFMATTAVVCIDPATCKFSFLGGFTWGFDVSATGVITQQALGFPADNAALRTVFNDALQLGPAGFKKWQMVQGAAPYMSVVVPEPSTVLAMSIGLAGLALVQLRQRRRAA